MAPKILRKFFSEKRARIFLNAPDLEIFEGRPRSPLPLAPPMECLVAPAPVAIVYPSERRLAALTEVIYPFGFREVGRSSSSSAGPTISQSCGPFELSDFVEARQLVEKEFQSIQRSVQGQAEVDGVRIKMEFEVILKSKAPAAYHPTSILVSQGVAPAEIMPMPAATAAAPPVPSSAFHSTAAADAKSADFAAAFLQLENVPAVVDELMETGMQVGRAPEVDLESEFSGWSDPVEEAGTHMRLAMAAVALEEEEEKQQQPPPPPPTVTTSTSSPMTKKKASDSAAEERKERKKKRLQTAAEEDAERADYGVPSWSHELPDSARTPFRKALHEFFSHHHLNKDMLYDRWSMLLLSPYEPERMGEMLYATEIPIDVIREDMDMERRSTILKIGRKKSGRVNYFVQENITLTRWFVKQYPLDKRVHEHEYRVGRYLEYLFLLESKEAFVSEFHPGNADCSLEEALPILIDISANWSRSPVLACTGIFDVEAQESGYCFLPYRPMMSLLEMKSRDHTKSKCPTQLEALVGLRDLLSIWVLANRGHMLGTFVHGDMNDGQIMWLKDERRFVLGDFSHSFVTDNLRYTDRALVRLERPGISLSESEQMSWTKLVQSFASTKGLLRKQDAKWIRQTLLQKDMISWNDLKILDDRIKSYANGGKCSAESQE
jgi:hypothetical protein